MPAYNERFGASGGVARSTFCGYFHLLWLIQTAVNPTSDTNPPKRYLSFGGGTTLLKR